MGLAHTSGVKASIIEAVNVFIAILVAGFLFHQEKITSRKITGCILGFAGVVLINLNGMNFQFVLQEREPFSFLRSLMHFLRCL